MTHNKAARALTLGPQQAGLKQQLSFRMVAAQGSRLETVIFRIVTYHASLISHISDERDEV
jgi:hypothetical protein